MRSKRGTISRNPLYFGELKAQTLCSVVRNLHILRQLLEVDEFQQFLEFHLSEQILDLVLPDDLRDLLILHILTERIQVRHPLIDDGLYFTGKGVAATECFQHRKCQHAAQRLATEFASGCWL